MTIEDFRKACFDLVEQCETVRVHDPDIADLLVRNDVDGLWIRFTAIGSLLDYCKRDEPGSVYAYCMTNLVFNVLIKDAIEGGD